MSRGLLLKVALVLVVLWGAVWAVAGLAGKRTATPEKVVTMLQENPLADEEDEADRREAIEKAADQINRLDFNQRQELREMENDPGAGAFFESMDEEEMAYFVELTIEQHFKEAMKAFNAMEPEERQKMINRAMKEMERDQSENGRGDLADLGDEERETLKKVAEEGMRAYYQEASAETKMDLAPLLEKIQGRMQGLR